MNYDYAALSVGKVVNYVDCILAKTIYNKLYIVIYCL